MNLVIPLIIPFITPILDGIARKVRAKIQDRIGPPVLQTWYDFISLFGMESIDASGSLTFRLAPYLAFGSAMAMLFLLPYGDSSPFGFKGDLIAFIYFFALFSAVVVLSGMSVESSYTMAGASREITLSLVFKPAFAVVVALFALKSGSLSIEEITHSLHLAPSVIGAYALLIYITYVEAGFIPYDIAEAETEILGGVLSEYSGRALAVFLWAFQIKRFAMIWLLSSMIVLPFVGGVKALVAQFLTALTIFTLMVVYESMNARHRLDIAVRKGIKALAAGCILLILAFFGW